MKPEDSASDVSNVRGISMDNASMENNVNRKSNENEIRDGETNKNVENEENGNDMTEGDVVNNDKCVDVIPVDSVDHALVLDDYNTDNNNAIILDNHNTDNLNGVAAICASDVTSVTMTNVEGDNNGFQQTEMSVVSHVLTAEQSDKEAVDRTSDYIVDVPNNDRTSDYIAVDADNDRTSDYIADVADNDTVDIMKTDTEGKLDKDSVHSEVDATPYDAATVEVFATPYDAATVEVFATPYDAATVEECELSSTQAADFVGSSQKSIDNVVQSDTSNTQIGNSDIQRNDLTECQELDLENNAECESRRREDYGADGDGERVPSSPSTDPSQRRGSSSSLSEVKAKYEDILEDEDLSTLSKRIAKKSDMSSSQLYMLTIMDEDDDDFDDLEKDSEFVPPDLSRSVNSESGIVEKFVEINIETDNVTSTGTDVKHEPVMSPLSIAKEVTVSESTSPRSQIVLKQDDAVLVKDASSKSTTATPTVKEGVRRSESRRTSRKHVANATRPLPTKASSRREDEEENFVLTALSRAVEDGNLGGLKQILEEAKNFNINQSNRQGETLLHTAASNGHLQIVQFLHEKGLSLETTDKHGDSAVYWAARQGHLEVIKYLVDNGISLNVQNKAGEAPIHVAARYGHLDLIEYLCGANVEVNVQDKLGETALHTVAWHGLPPEICALLCTSGCKVDTRNKENETPLHCAASRGNLECVRVLLSHGASLNVQDKRLNTPLHLACRRRYVSIALLLLHAGCAFDLPDCINETPLHPASREGLLPVVQTMCAYGCQVDIINKGGLTSLHLASRSGHTEVVRCLLLSGSEPELPNKDGVNSEIMALAQGHQEVAELLGKLKPEKREICIKQLIPTNQPLTRVKVKVFGSSGVGKTTLIDSLKCGYLSSFFRKARISNSTSSNNVKLKGMGNGTISRQNSLPTQLSFELAHEGYTQGIDVQQVSLSGGAGDLSIWEFSGYEPYYVLYDHFIGDPNCIHMIIFNLADPQDVQLSQVLFWLNFLKARLAPMEPIGPAGRLPWPARVMLVATHADKVECTKNSFGELENRDAFILLATIKEKYESDLFIQDEIYITDGHLAMSQDLKSIRTKLGQMKNQIIQYLPCSNGFLDATVQAMAIWRKALSDYPVVTWPVFMEYVRSKVNLLASDEHLKELMCQLQLLGEVIYIETVSEQDLVVLNPRWLCCEVIGHLLSHEQLSHSRPTGCFTPDDFQLICPETDARDMLIILEALELCTRCEVDGEVEYEFPCLNFVEMIPGLWDRDDGRMSGSVYGGVRIHCPRGMNNQLLHMFPRIQTHLRREINSDNMRADSDLYQWYHGSKFCSGAMECLVTLSQSEQVVEVKCRGPPEFRTSLYYFQEDVCDIVLDVIEDSCPGLCLEKYVLSATELRQHKTSVYAYTPKDILSAQLDGSTSISLNESTNEEFIDLIAFGSEEIWNNITPGIDLHAHYLSIHARRRLSRLLDPPDAIGRDWCMLAVTLGLTADLPRVDQSEQQMIRSKTDTILDMWSRDQSSSIAVLIRKLRELGRQDAADALLTVSPLYHLFQDANATEGAKTSTEQTPYNSDNTLSSSNLSR